jgi:hypothetical protein
VAWGSKSTVVLAAALGVACNALTGASDLAVGAEGAGADAGTAAADAATPAADGAPDDGGGEPPEAPLPVCGAARVCVPIGAGWTPVTSPRAATSPCQSDYASTADLVRAATGDSCGCTCQPSIKVSCPSRAVFGVGTLAKCDSTTSEIDFPADASCAPLSIGGAPGSYVAFNGTAPFSGSWSCAATPTPSFSPPAATRVCSGATGSPDGCSGGELCVPAASTTARNCVVHDGDVECPEGMTRRSVVGADPKDGRGCSACTCANDSCTSGSLKATIHPSCLAVNDVLVGACTFNQYASGKLTPSNGCKVTTPSAVTGAVTLSAVRTLCCR